MGCFDTSFLLEGHRRFGVYRSPRPSAIARMHWNTLPTGNVGDKRFAGCEWQTSGFDVDAPEKLSFGKFECLLAISRLAGLKVMHRDRTSFHG